MKSPRLLLALLPAAAALRPRAAPQMQLASAPAIGLAAAAALSSPLPASAARSGGRVGGRVVSGGGGYRGGGGGGGYRGGYGGSTNVYVAPPMSPFGFGGFGFSPFGYGFSPFGFGFGVPAPLLLLFLGGAALTSFRSARGIEASDKAGAALCLQVACYCDDRNDSLYGRLQSVARSAETQSYEGLQRLCSDSCLAMLRSSKDWLAGRTESTTAGLLTNDVETSYNRLVVQERSKWESEQGALTRSAPGQPTYMVATLVVLLRQGSELPSVSTAADLREAISALAADVSVEDNLLAAELLWTPEDGNDVMERDDLFLNFPELVNV